METFTKLRAKMPSNNYEIFHELSSDFDPVFVSLVTIVWESS